VTPRRLSERLAGLPVLRDSALLHHAAYQARVLLQRRHLTVRLDTNNRCNLRCRMCYFSLPELDRAPRRELTLPEFRALAAAAFPRARRVFLSCAYEPLLSPIFDDALADLAASGVPET